ncbi:MAG: hypothetical protein ABI538_00180 [Pseudoxanthomonas sp.]
MTKPYPAVFFAVALITILAVTYASNHARSGELVRSAWGGGSQEETNARLLKAQSDILARLDRLEATRSGQGNPRSRSGWNPQSGNSVKSNGALNMTAADLAAKQASVMQSLDNKFADEPLTAAWAIKTEHTISSILSPSALAKEQATAPKSVESTCRSQTCRISMRFDDGTQGDFTRGIFLQSIGENLPSAKIFQQQQADGSVGYVIYAQTATSANPRI